MNGNGNLTTEAINVLNIDCYNAKADFWDRMPFPQVLPDQILALHNSKTGMNALDIGSGTGMLADWLSKNGFNVLCIDPSDEMVRRCRSKGLSTLQTTLQEFNTDQKFGLVTAVLSLIHVPKKELSQQLQKISNWMNPGGTFAMAFIEGQGEGIGEKQSAYPRYFSYYTSAEMVVLTRPYFECVFEFKMKGPISYIILIFRKLPNA
jgi:2-polyprenyl-3-methyl-5-hydroxy-6-metoxy-1,4-benzoquinol methylase